MTKSVLKESFSSNWSNLLFTDYFSYSSVNFLTKRRTFWYMNHFCGSRGSRDKIFPPKVTISIYTHIVTRAWRFWREKSLWIKAASKEDAGCMKQKGQERVRCRKSSRCVWMWERGESIIIIGNFWRPLKTMKGVSDFFHFQEINTRP